VATVLDTVVRLTDDGVGLFDRLMGRVAKYVSHGDPSSREQ
jgi:hypothetical protein